MHQDDTIHHGFLDRALVGPNATIIADRRSLLTLPPFSYWRPALQTFASLILLPAGGKSRFSLCPRTVLGGFVFFNTAAQWAALFIRRSPWLQVPSRNVVVNRLPHGT